MERVSPAALYCLLKLNQAGYRAYLVGGCVRDLLRGVSPHDYDLCTNAPPQEICSVFSNEKTVLTGLRHGTVTVFHDGEPFEITTFRTEGGYSDGRHPDKVSFTQSLTEDLSRRDFTMNAIAWHPSDGLIDPFYGEEAICRKRISCVGDPLLRFEEDALRMLRAIRFECCLGFSIDPSIASAIQDKAGRIKEISRERIREELSKILLSERAFEGASRLLFFLGKEIFEVATPPLPSNAILNHLSCCEPLRYAAFLLESDQPENLLRSLRCSSALVRSVLTILRAVHTDYPTDKKGARMLRRDAGADTLSAAELIDILRQDHGMGARVVSSIERGEPVSLAELAVSGADLIQAGIPAGRHIGTILTSLLELVIEAPERNEKNFLLRKARKINPFA